MYSAEGHSIPTQSVVGAHSRLSLGTFVNGVRYSLFVCCVVASSPHVWGSIHTVWRRVRKCTSNGVNKVRVGAISTYKLHEVLDILQDFPQLLSCGMHG